MRARHQYDRRSLRRRSGPAKRLFCRFRGWFPGAPRSVRDRPSQVKGAFGVPRPPSLSGLGETPRVSPRGFD